MDQQNMTSVQNDDISTHQVDPTVPPSSTYRSRFLTYASFGILIIVIGLFCGWFLGRSVQTPQKNTTDTTPTSVKNEVVNKPPIISEEPMKAIHREKVGTSGNVHAGGLKETIFKPYSMHISDGWVVTGHEVEENSIDKLVVGNVANNAYSFSIYQAGFGGGICYFSGDGETLNGVLYDNFVDISSTLRRSWKNNMKPDVDGNIHYLICGKPVADEPFYATATVFGGIEIVAPYPADESILREIDTMLRTLH